MRVPASVADTDKPAPRLNQSAAQQAALAQRGQPVPLANLGILGVHVERLAGSRRRDQLESFLVVGRHRGRAATLATLSGKLLDTRQQAATKIEAATTGAGSQVQVSHLEIRLHRIGLDHERRVLGAEEAGSPGAHRLGNADVGRHAAAMAQFTGAHRTNRRIELVERGRGGLAVAEAGPVAGQAPVPPGLVSVVAVAV